jgi:DNA-dependent RNA polymerase auxiliary subunit epsilon
MIRSPDSVKRYHSARQRFLKAAFLSFFAREFPKLFGPLMRERIVDELLQMVDTMMPPVKRVKPGQIVWNALDKQTRGDSPNRRYVTVILTLISEDDVRALVKGVPMSSIAKSAVARVILEAYQQGALLSMRDIGLLTWRYSGAVSQLRKAYEQETETCLPHTGNLHDMGSCISHKATIVTKVVREKKDPLNVARETKHTLLAVDKYLKDYHRVKMCSEKNWDIEFIHRITGLSKPVVKQYLELIHDGD